MRLSCSSSSSSRELLVAPDVLPLALSPSLLLLLLLLLLLMFEEEEEEAEDAAVVRVVSSATRDTADTAAAAAAPLPVRSAPTTITPASAPLSELALLSSPPQLSVAADLGRSAWSVLPGGEARFRLLPLALLLVALPALVPVLASSSTTTTSSSRTCTPIAATATAAALRTGDDTVLLLLPSVPDLLPVPTALLPLEVSAGGT
mmetsp:Transcript_28252/g.62054  ORF Transcript_28252/g.62054 Transcript_28252/m.62054 type:complete len:204 (+) Transcript_28252:2536-3147(+)